MGWAGHVIWNLFDLLSLGHLDQEEAHEEDDMNCPTTGTHIAYDHTQLRYSREQIRGSATLDA